MQVRRHLAHLEAAGGAVHRDYRLAALVRWGSRQLAEKGHVEGAMRFKARFEHVATTV